MFDTTGYALISVAVSTALLHTLIPDHWLPFVLIGNARGWRAGTTVAVSGVSALIHVLLSIVLGVAALAIGKVTASAVVRMDGPVRCDSMYDSMSSWRKRTDRQRICSSTSPR